MPALFLSYIGKQELPVIVRVNQHGDAEKNAAVQVQCTPVVLGQPQKAPGAKVADMPWRSDVQDNAGDQKYQAGKGKGQ